MNFRHALIVGCSALLFASCTTRLVPLISVARFSPAVKESFAVKTNSAVVYGRFGLEPQFAFGNVVAVRLRSEDSKREYLIRCRDKEPVYAIAVEPGRYRVAGFVATFVDRRPVGRRNLPQIGPFEVRPNAGTYLGDFTAFAKIRGLAQEWGIRRVSDNFATTTAEFRAIHTNFASVEMSSAFEKPPVLVQR